MKKTITLALMLVVSLLGFTIQAQAPQTGVYRIQNAGAKTYVKVTGKYDAQLVSSQSDASYITVGIEKKLSDGTYKVNSLYSTYGAENTPVEVYDYIPKALRLAEIELRKILKNSSGENVQKAINRMHELAQQYGFMRMMPVDGQADTYHAIAVLPFIPNDVVEQWEAKVDYDGSMWQWCKDLVISYLDQHSGEGGTDAGLASRIRNNLAKIQEGHTYMLTTDTDGSFGYINTGENFKDQATGETTVNPATLTSSNDRSWWKLTPKVNNENVKDGTYKIRNIGNEKYVRIRGRYYATPDAEESAASDIRITFDGEANGGQKIINLGGTYNGTDIDIYSYIEKAIMIGKMAIYDVLTDGNGVNPASDENIEFAQNYLETEVKKGAFMCIKPVEGNDEAVYAYATIPHIPEAVVTQMYKHKAITADSEELAWQFGVNKVKQYLNDHSGQGGTDNTLRSYILANIDKIRPGATYYLGAESNNTFDYSPKFDTYNNWGTQTIIDNFNDIKENTLFQWGFDVKDVEEENLTSGTYKIRNVQYENFVEVLSKYYAKPDTDEANATEIHITYDGKLDDGSYKVTNMSAVAKDGSMCDIQSYVDKAIMLGKVAIAEVLKNMSDPEDIAYAQQYMEDFVRAAAFMRVKPVAGTNYVYAIATIPEIPYDVYHEMYRHGVITADTKEAAWDYGVQYVMNYLSTHGTNSTLAQLITNNINKIQQGHTYYLSEDADHTFGYVDAENFSATDKTIQWGIDLEEEDQPVESDFYKIHNVGQNTYVKVYPPYYAKPDQDDEANATPIAVTIGEQMPDGGYKITNLAGDGCDVQQYVQHAIELGEGVIDQVLNGVSTPENIAKAKQAMRDFIEANAYMQIRLVPGETDAYYAYATAPVIPEEITSEWRKKYPNYEGDMWAWCVEKVKSYLGSHGTNNTLANLVLNNIDKIQEGHTYYLSAEDNGTFGYKDAAQMDFTDRDYWWGFADAIKAEPVSGYFRIKGADGNYVNVTGKFDAKPNASAADAKTAAGTVIYVGTGETKNTKTLPIEILRSQGVDVGATSGYMFMINDVLKVVANKVAEIAEAKVQESSYSQYASLIKPAVNTLLESVDLNLYIEPTLTSTGEEAYMLEVTTPNLAEYVDLANSALSLMGKKGADLVDNLEAMKKGDNGVMDKLISAAQEMVVMLDQPKTANGIADDIWALLKQKGKTFLSSYSQQLSALLPEQAITFINNALNNPDFNYGTTYCLRQDADGTFGYASRESLINNDAAKWILEPFDEQDPNYYTEAYIPFVVETEFAQATITNEQNVGVTIVGDTYYFTTTYLDFDAKIETQNVKVYTVASTDRVESHKNAVGDKPAQTLVYYIAKLKDVEGDYIPAATPVLLRAEDSEIQLRPINKPKHPAVESGELGEAKDLFIETLLSKLNGVTQGAPSLKHISTPTTDNPLVGSFLGDDVKEEDANNYMQLSNQTKRDEEGPIGLDMEGLGFWKAENGLDELKGNKAYLKGYDEATDSSLADFHSYTTFAAGNENDAPGYIFQYPDGDNTFTRIENVNTDKEVKSVRYYNTLGVESATPFEGVNIVVTTYSDGTTSTEKILK